jgi:hypothetical protein
MYHEWMFDIPIDLSDNWLSLIRPDGFQCLLVAQGESTLITQGDNQVFLKFQTCIPGGSVYYKPSSSICILDCIFSNQTEIFYTIDLMTWNGFDLLQTTKEARMFFLSSKLSGEQNFYIYRSLKRLYCNEIIYKQKFSPLVVCIPFFPCHILGLLEAYNRQITLHKGGLIFEHKSLLYYPGFICPLTLLWKDNACTKFLLDTEKSGKIMDRQQIALKYYENGNLMTFDEVFLIMEKTNFEMIRSISRLHPRLKIIFDLWDRGILKIEGSSIILDARWKRIARSYFNSVDSISKIIFQMQARGNPISFKMMYDLL